MRRNIFVLLFVCSAALAQIEGPPRVGVGVIRKELSLAQAIELAVRNNLEVQVEKTGVSSAVESRKGARGFLDPRLRWQPMLENRNTPTSSALIGVDGKLVERIHSQNFYFDQRLPWAGSTFNVSFENDRESTSNPFVALSPFITTRLRFALTLPLLRNREIDRERANLRVTARQVELSESNVEVKVIEVVERVEEAYWNLVAARQNVQVSSEAVNLAREQLARTRRMIDSGTLAPVEIAAAEAELERRVDTWYASIGQVTQVENALKVLITGSRHEPLWDDEIVPEERVLEAPQFDQVRQAVDLSLKRRPELRQVGIQEETNAIQSELARNQTLPAMNLVGGYLSSGLAGSVTTTQNPFVEVSAAQIARLNELSRLQGLPPLPPASFGGAPDKLIGGYGSVLGGVFENRYPTAFVGLQFDFTARNRAAESELAQTAVNERRLKLQRALVEQRIEAQVRNALQELETARQRITAAESSARASQEKLDSEVRLFQTGESTNFLVLTRQNELADSRQRVVAAKADFNKAVARLRLAVGTTLETYNITVQ
ncbi:MAG: TolC family protein [Bryobacteraceae bacterium]|nr:TolC family protein [Bryobacteraceae bacterium]